MKKLTGIIAILILISCNQGKVFQAPSKIHFYEGTYQKALQKAKAENKKLYVFIYTDWCGYCKKMMKQVYAKEEVGAVYNAKFINLKLDAEKGDGIALVKKFGIHLYPTQLFIDANEQEVYRADGYTSVEETIFNGNAIP